MQPAKLSEDDQRRVDEVTHSGIHSVERKPFRPLILLLVILAVTTAMTLLSIYIERITIG